MLRVVYSEHEMSRFIGPEVPQESARWVDHPFLPFVGKPATEYELDVPVGDGRVHVTVRNNAFGFRSHELPAEKAPSDYFIVALGESTTWGAIAATNAQAWPELLEAKLRARYPERNVRTFNFGTQNVTSAYSVVALALIGVHVRPDLVIAYHGLNEVAPALAPTFRVDHAHFMRDLELDRRWHGVQMSLPRGLLLRSRAAAFVTGLADRALGANALSFYVQHRVDVIEDAGMEAALLRNWSHLGTIDAIARGVGAQALFATFQFFDGDDPVYQMVNGTLRRFFADNAMSYLDLDALLPDGDRTLQYDVCHFTADGEERVAESFFRKIVDEGYVEPR